MFSIVDERSAGFFALGIGKASGRPAVVITTSGTAAANLYPAVIEASQGEVPLLVLTADRPHRLRDTDGNQAMDQIRLFGTFPRGFFEIEPPVWRSILSVISEVSRVRAVSLAVGPPRGPVHLNFPFEKPLEPCPSEPRRIRGLSVGRDGHYRAWTTTPLREGDGRGGEPFVRMSPAPSRRHARAGGRPRFEGGIGRTPRGVHRCRSGPGSQERSGRPSWRWRP